ncbi:MAG: hypothetical protein Q7T33_01715 [Dehalococcoidia bacterium]|nr:hypothetical protein [Dehalococcoidia bacterium]
MVGKADEWTLEPRRVALSRCFRSVLYPVNVVAVLDRLPELGWVVEERVEEENSIRIGAPKKGNLRLQLDQSAKTLGVVGDDLAQALIAYRELMQAASDVSSYTSGIGTLYVEFRYLGDAHGDKVNPLEVFARWWGGAERVESFGSEIAKDLPSDASRMIPYGIRLAPEGNDANRPNWTELTIAPSNTSGETKFHFDLLFRNESSAKTEEVAENADAIIRRALAQLTKA